MTRELFTHGALVSLESHCWWWTCQRNLEGSEASATTWLSIVRMSKCVSGFTPSARVPSNIIAKGGQQCAIKYLGLTIHLWMVQAFVQICHLSMLHTSAKKPGVYCFSTLARNLLGELYRKIKSLAKTVGVSCAAVVPEGIVLVSFEKMFVFSNNAVLPLFDSVNELRMSILTYANGLMAGKSFGSVAYFWSLMRSRPQKKQFFTTLYASTLIDAQ